MQIQNALTSIALKLCKVFQGYFGFLFRIVATYLKNNSTHKLWQAESILIYIIEICVKKRGVQRRHIDMKHIISIDKLWQTAKQSWFWDVWHE